ncbi:phenazine biosynthesis protein [Bordetella genomosp. 5]|nr:phenazine biosynthesis protein [Bordetella genomosp. 5]
MCGPTRRPHSRTASPKTSPSGARSSSKTESNLTEYYTNPPAPPPAGAAALLRVFVDTSAARAGGNPVPLVLDARGMSDAAMQALAAQHGHESAFVLPPDAPDALCRLRFFVPGHEMEMCGHATVGSLWALRQWGRWTTPRTRVQTLSGSVDAEWDEARGGAWISQPAVSLEPLPQAHCEAIAQVLGIDAAHAAVNASTSRVKTLVRMPDAEALDALTPDFGAMRGLCERIGSTGLYPYAVSADGVFARQFPKASGYPEDAATGIAAAALWGYLDSVGAIPAGAICTVYQGRAMGSPSAIHLRRRADAPGCWLSGETQWMA